MFGFRVALKCTKQHGLGLEHPTDPEALCMGRLLPALGLSPAGVRGAGGRALLDGIPGGISVKPACQAGLRLKSGFVLHVRKVCSTGLLPVASGDHLCFRRLTGSPARAQRPGTGGMAACSCGG